jgi:hypothetical protein
VKLPAHPLFLRERAPAVAILVALPARFKGPSRGFCGGNDLAAQDELLEQGFQLALFVFPERLTALRILSGAMNKLKVQRGRENRRAYWRDKYLKRGITRITRNEADTLQWLILFESEQYEIEQEQRNEQTLHDMVQRFVKVVVRAGTGMSLFYTNVGVHRLLHHYSTTETQRIYETLADRYLGADEYRRAKGVLVSKLLDRFGPFLICDRGPRGELRFEVEHDQARWAPLVEECLKAFTPWSTAQSCPLPSNFNQNNLLLPPQLSGRGNAFDPDQIEINRCHAVIDPGCHARLLQALTFAPSQQKLAIPRFKMESTQQDPGAASGPTRLTPAERKSVQSSLAQQSSKRAKAMPNSARILVDGAERARLSFLDRNQSGFVIDEGAELIELRSECEGEDLLLAVHRIAYTGENGIAGENTLLYQNRGLRLALAITPDAPAGEKPGSATVTLESQPAVAFGWRSNAIWLSPWKWAAAQVLAAAILLGIGWWMGSRLQERSRPADGSSNSLTTASPQPTPVQHALAQPQENSIQAYRLVPDESMTRGGQGQQPPVVTLYPEPSLVRLELPVSAEYSRQTFRVRMHKFGGTEEMLSENLLSARLDHQIWLVDFDVPSKLLTAGKEYAVEVRVRMPGGTTEEIASYIFHAK